MVPTKSNVARAEAYLHVKFRLESFNCLATVHERHRQDRTDRQRTDSIGRTVLQTVAQKPETGSSVQMEYLEVTYALHL